MEGMFNCDNAEIIAQLPDKSVDMILEDMPYNTTNCDFEYAVDLKKYWAERLRIIKDNGVIVLTAQQPFASDLIHSCRKLFRYEIIWQKTNKLGFFNANKMPMRGHENILIFYKKLPTYNPQKYKVDVNDLGRVRKQRSDRYDGYSTDRGGQFIETGLRFPHSVITFSNHNGGGFGGKGKEKTVHPTQKPVELFRWLIRTYTNSGDIVFDGYGGSGTTALAATLENRKFCVCEWNEAYFDKANERLNAIKKNEAQTLF